MSAYRVVVIGCSAGGLKALEEILVRLLPSFPLPILMIQHMASDPQNYLVTHLNRVSRIRVYEAMEKKTIQAGEVLVSPPNYHLLLEKDATLSLSVDKKVNHARPSIDVLFESAVDAFSDATVGVLLTGANADGALGLKRIRQQGGMTIVQDPKTAEAPFMPLAAIELDAAMHVIPLVEIAGFLQTLVD
ncbi:MAG: chemotaxis protein CheB [Magnetococcales bacterium]|nr:chemotaxis protein CheB [Magnetococcales bacterium]